MAADRAQTAAPASRAATATPGAAGGGVPPRPPIDRRALGRRLSALADASTEDVLAMAGRAAGGAARIGLTGPPGAGKSSLGGRLALLRARTRRIGLLAIDPTSPRSGGAILGDRIRIDELDGSAELYVRSLASRSAADGLADNLPELLGAMEEAGFDEIVVETVGVGQAEHAVRSLVDTLVLVLVPGSGDVVQAMKAGIMEMADVYVVNKADLPGAAQVAADVTRILRVFPAPSGAWVAPVVQTAIGDAGSIAALATLPFVAIVNPALPVKTVADLAALSKKQPVNFGSAGNGSVNHLLGEMFNSAAGIRMTHIPYRGAAAALTDLIGGQVQVVFTSLPSAASFIRNGTVRPIAVTSGKRAGAFPDIPTIIESGYPGFDVTPWFGLFATGGTPAAVVARLNQDINAVLGDPEVVERFAAQGAEAYRSSPEQFAKLLSDDIAVWSKIVKASGAKVD